MRYVTGFACLFSSLLCGQTPAPETNAGRLPVKRVVLYKNGVGYFEHLGQVRGDQDMTIAFTSGQLNDVLKSLTVLDLAGGRISGVTYGSAAPLGRRLGQLRLSLSEKATLTDFLSALRGARLEVRSGTSVVAGRLLSIERKTRISGGTTLEVDYLSLITDTGDVRTAELSPAFSVRILDRDLTGDVGRYMDLLSSTRDADLRRMVVATKGSGDRPLFVSYISEVPVWKTTYRIVLSKKQPLLQGWAIVDNTVGEDWDGVQMSLVAGAPQSFIQKLSQPYYTRRPEVPLPESFSVTPQTHEATLVSGGASLTGAVGDPSGATVLGARVRVIDGNGSVVGEATTNRLGIYEFKTLPAGVFRLEVEYAGFKKSIVSGISIFGSGSNRQDVTLEVGNITQAVEVTAATAALQTETAGMGLASRSVGSGRNLGSGSQLRGGQPGRGSAGVMAAAGTDGLAEARARAEAAAQAQGLGDLFEYKLKEPITIRKNQSAMVPIVQANVGAEKVSLWNERNAMRHPQHALWVTNSSGLTLDGGSFSVLEEETFAGEGIFDSIRAGERRLITYAVDLGVTASSQNRHLSEQITRVKVHKGVITHTSEVREKKTYVFRNEDTSPRSVLIEHPVRSGYKRLGGPEPEESTEAWQRFRVRVEPKQTASFEILEARPSQATYALTNITPPQLAFFVQQKTVNPAVEASLKKILAQKDLVAALKSDKEELEQENERIFDDQQRLRENMKALRGSAEEKALLQRYTSQLNDQENRLEAIKKESAELDRKISDAEDALSALITDLEADFEVQAV